MGKTIRVTPKQLPVLLARGGAAAPALGLKTNLVGWWELDEASGNRADSHTNGLTLTDNNTVTQAAGVGGVGNSAQFTSANSESLTRANNSLFEGGDVDLTVAAWVYADTEETSPVFVSRWGAAGGAFEWQLGYTSAADRFRVLVRNAADSANTTVTATTFGAPTTATWYFLVFQHDAVNDLVKISVNDGSFNTGAHAGGMAVGNTSLAIGRLMDTGRYVNGRIQRVGLWRSAAGGGGVLSAAQITALYNAGASLGYASLT